MRKRGAHFGTSDHGLWDRIRALQLHEFFSSTDEEYSASLADLSLVAFESGFALCPEPLWEGLLGGSYVVSRLLSSKDRKTHLSSAEFATLAQGAPRIAPVVTCREQIRAQRSRLSGKLMVCMELASLEYLLVLDRASSYLVSLEGKGVKRRAMPSLDLTVPVYEITLKECPAREFSTRLSGLGEIYLSMKASELAGISARVVAMTAQYVKERKQFGVAVGSFQAIQHALADMHLRAESASSLSRFAAWTFDSSPDQFSFAAQAAFRYLAEWAPSICEKAVQLHGGIGFTWEYDLHLYLRRARTISAAVSVPESDEFLKLARRV